MEGSRKEAEESELFSGTGSACVRPSGTDSARTEEVGPETVLDFGADGNVVGIEIYLRAAGRLGLSRIRLERRPGEGPDASVTFEMDFPPGTAGSG